MRVDRSFCVIMAMVMFMFIFSMIIMLVVVMVVFLLCMVIMLVVIVLVVCMVVVIVMLAVVIVTTVIIMVVLCKIPALTKLQEGQALAVHEFNGFGASRQGFKRFLKKRLKVMSHPKNKISLLYSDCR